MRYKLTFFLSLFRCNFLGFALGWKTTQIGRMYREKDFLEYRLLQRLASFLYTKSETSVNTFNKWTEIESIPLFANFTKWIILNNS